MADVFTQGGEDAVTERATGRGRQRLERCRHKPGTLRATRSWKGFQPPGLWDNKLVFLCGLFVAAALGD